MKVATKPISSPGRAENYPPPLMRFLRSNGGSKSRGRLRSSPLFVRKKNAAAIETQEPSSPKVTCMGQVRVRTSSKNQTSKACSKSGGVTSKRRCLWIRTSLFCNHFPRKINSKFILTLLRKWILFFRVGFRSRFGKRKVPSKNGSKFIDNFENSEQEEEEEEEEDDEEDEDETAVKVFSSSYYSTPPRNALLLTRCRSAPYQSSSLACRFWSSPLKSEEENEEEEQSKTEWINREERSQIEKPTSQRDSVSNEETKNCPEFEEKLRFFKELENSIRETLVKSAKVKKLVAREREEDDEKEKLGDSKRSLILTRCKSEPARIAKKLNPEFNFWEEKTEAKVGFNL